MRTETTGSVTTEDVLNALGRYARILERQKMLQTSQVLFRPLCVSLAVVLPFKDSQGGTWLLN
jgi:hypothetical protein